MIEEKVQYPEHEKLRAVGDKSQAIGEFLDWMASEGIHRVRFGKLVDRRVCIEGGVLRHDPETCKSCDSSGFYEIEIEQYINDGRSIEQLLADYFGIDRDRLESEKRLMLEALR